MSNTPTDPFATHAPRRRFFSPWYRPRNILLLLIGLPIALLLVAASLVWFQPMGQPGKYAADIERLVSARQPATGPEGWPDLIAALDALESAQKTVSASMASANPLLPSPSDMYTQVYDGLREGDADPEAARADRLELSRRYIAGIKATGALSAFDKAAGAARFNRPAPTGEVISLLLPDLGRARNAARMCGGRIALGFEAGDYGEVENAFEHALMLSRAMGAQFTLIDHLVAVAIFALAEDRIRAGLVLHPPQGQEGRAFLERLAAIIDRQGELPSLAHALEGERLGTLDTIEWTHTDDGAGNGTLVLNSANALAGGGGPTSPSPFARRLGAVAGLAFASKATTKALANEFYDEFKHHTEVPRPQRDGLDLLDRRIDKLDWRQRLLSLLLPALNKSLQSNDAYKLDRLGIRTMIAIEIFRCRTGAYPERLEDLVPAELPAILPEPISGLPLVYRRIDPAQDPHRRGYTLYAVGNDRADNGGNFPASKDRMSVIVDGPPRPGLDFEINNAPEGAPK